jgi:acetyl esterase/lipase
VYHYFCALGVLLAVSAAVMSAPDSSQTVRKSHRLESNIVYVTRGSVPVKLDLYLPTAESKTPRPAVMLFHGGAWTSGVKEEVGWIAAWLADQGYVVAAPSYRLAPEHKHPAQIEDCKRAVRWVRRNAKKYNIDPKRIAAMGFSAGAHLSAMLGVGKDLEYLAGDKNDVSAKVQAVIGVSGPYVLAPPPGQKAGAGLPDLSYWLGGTAAEKLKVYQEVSPAYHVTRYSPPSLLIAGNADMLTPPYLDAVMAAKLREKGVPVETILVKNAGHVLIPVPDKQIEPSLPEIQKKALDFLRKHLR